MFDELGVCLVSIFYGFLVLFFGSKIHRLKSIAPPVYKGICHRVQVQEYRLDIWVGSLFLSNQFYIFLRSVYYYGSSYEIRP